MPGLTEDEQALVVAVRRAERRAAETLYVKLIPCVRRALWRLVRHSTADQDDLVQITFERVIQTIVDGRFGGTCSLSSWATSIATHAAIDHHRARARERRIFKEDEDLVRVERVRVPATLDTERALHARSELDHVLGLLSRMKSSDARVLLLCDGFGYSVAEAATALGSTQAATGSRLTRARREFLRRAGKIREGRLGALRVGAPA